MYKIGYEDKEIIIRLSGDLIDKESLSKILDYIELESIRKKSKLSNEQAIALAKEVDQEVWKSIRKTTEVK